jgi:hypothetical protein
MKLTQLPTMDKTLVDKTYSPKIPKLIKFRLEHHRDIVPLLRTGSVELCFHFPGHKAHAIQRY